MEKHAELVTGGYLDGSNASLKSEWTMTQPDALFCSTQPLIKEKGGNTLTYRLQTHPWVISASRSYWTDVVVALQRKQSDSLSSGSHWVMTHHQTLQPCPLTRQLVGWNEIQAPVGVTKWKSLFLLSAVSITLPISPVESFLAWVWYREREEVEREDGSRWWECVEEVETYREWSEHM